MRPTGLGVRAFGLGGMAGSGGGHDGVGGAGGVGDVGHEIASLLRFSQ